MGLNELELNEGPRHNRKHVGCSTFNGYGETVSRGQKGQLARAGDKTRSGFGGDQMPLFRRMPKRGSKNVNRKEYTITNLNDLNRFDDDSEITIDTSKSSGLVKREFTGVKLLVNNELKVKLTIKVNKVSEVVKKTVKAAGGIVEVI